MEPRIPVNLMVHAEVGAIDIVEEGRAKEAIRTGWYRTSPERAGQGFQSETVLSASFQRCVDCA